MERKFMSKCLGKAREIVLFYVKSGKGWPLGHWKFRKFKPEWKAPLAFSAEQNFLLLLVFGVSIFLREKSGNEINQEFCATQYFLTAEDRTKLFKV